jgi:Na+-transporting NADH:ubiquinone oxidoreductase subunit NqrB
MNVSDMHLGWGLVDNRYEEAPNIYTRRAKKF